MSVGARIVALDTPFNRETLGDAGTFFEPDRAAEAFDALATEPAYVSEAYRRRAATRSATTFSLAAVADAYEALLTEVAALPRARGRAECRTRWEAAPELRTAGVGLP
jgi:hypothetical protein